MDRILADLYILPAVLPVRFLNASPLFRSAALSVRGIGIREAMPPSFIERPAGTGDYLFMLFYDRVQFGRERTTLPADTMVMWDRNAPHHYGCPDRRWLHSWVHCDGPAVGAIRGTLRLRGDYIVRLNDPSVVDRHLLDMNAEIGRGRRADPVIIGNLLENLIRSARRGEEPPARAAPIPPPIDATRAHLDLHYDRPLTLGELAATAGLSSRHLCSQFRRYVGMPPLAYLAYRRLQAAAALLRGTAEPIGEVGRRVGFRDPYHFSKRFRDRFGISPTAFRHAPPPRTGSTRHPISKTARDVNAPPPPERA